MRALWRHAKGRRAFLGGFMALLLVFAGGRCDQQPVVAREGGGRLPADDDKTMRQVMLQARDKDEVGQHWSCRQTDDSVGRA